MDGKGHRRGDIVSEAEEVPGFGGKMVHFGKERREDDVQEGFLAGESGGTTCEEDGCVVVEVVEKAEMVEKSVGGVERSL